jgi:hypothetical protein
MTRDAPERHGEVNHLIPCDETDGSSHWSQEIERDLLEVIYLAA